jgi:hypothetical protein
MHCIALYPMALALYGSAGTCNKYNTVTSAHPRRSGTLVYTPSPYARAPLPPLFPLLPFLPEPTLWAACLEGLGFPTTKRTGCFHLRPPVEASSRLITLKFCIANSAIFLYQGIYMLFGSFALITYYIYSLLSVNLIYFILRLSPCCILYPIRIPSIILCLSDPTTLHIALRYSHYGAARKDPRFAGPPSLLMLMFFYSGVTEDVLWGTSTSSSQYSPVEHLLKELLKFCLQHLTDITQSTLNTE